MAYDNTNTGVLFKNDRKESDKHPDYRGSININGEEFWLSAWINIVQKGDNAGKNYMSLKARSKSETSNKPAQGSLSNQNHSQQGNQEFDDDIPF